MLAALPVGGSFKLARSTETVEECAVLAKGCDAVICVTGGNLDWEIEGADRTQFALPGANDDLIERLLEAHSKTIIYNISVRFVWAPDLLLKRSLTTQRIFVLLSAMLELGSDDSDDVDLLL